MKENRFILADEQQLTWYEIGRGRPLVLLHGWCMSASVFSEVAALLASDFRLLIPDLPGHGESSPALKNDLAGIADDLVRWIAAIESEPVISNPGEIIFQRRRRFSVPRKIRNQQTKI